MSVGLLATDASVNFATLFLVVQSLFVIFSITSTFRSVVLFCISDSEVLSIIFGDGGAGS